MCEQQFDFVCAHIARLKQTERQKERERKKETERGETILLLHTLLERCRFRTHTVHTHARAHTSPSNAKKLKLHNAFFSKALANPHTHCTYTLTIYTRGLCRSLLEMQLILLSGQISNSNLTIDLYILSVINHRLCSLNKSNNTHTHRCKHTLKNTRWPISTQDPSHTHTHTHTAHNMAA